jgi:phage-related protein
MAITIPILTDFNSRGIDRGIKQFQKLETKGQKAGFLIRKAALPAALALGGIALAAKAGLDGVMADDEALANLQSTITSTGNAANITSESFFAYANQLQKVTGTGADQITQGAALLATFKNVRNEVGAGNQVFNRATKAALDLSKKGFGDLSGSNKMLGKALNDPIRGITALSRAGVTFTDEQKATIKTLQESGRTLDAQKIILREVEDQVGGTAEAFGETTRGKIERSKRAFEEMQKTLARALLPILEAAASIFQKLSGFIERNQKVSKIIIGVIAALAAGVLILNVAMKAFAVILAVISLSPVVLIIGAIVLAVAALTIGFIALYKKSETFRKIVTVAFESAKKVIGKVVDFLKGPVLAAWEVIQGVLEVIKGLIEGDFSRVWEGIKTTIGGVLDGIKTSILGFPLLIGGAVLAIGRTIVSKIAEGVSDIASKVWDKLKGLPGALLNLAVGWVQGLGTLGGRVITYIARGVTGLADAAWNNIKGFAAVLGEKVMGIADSIKAIGRKIIDYIIDGFEAAASGIVSGLKGIINKAIDLVNGGIRKVNSLSRKVNKILPGDPIGQIGEIPRLAKGGIVRSPTLALIGEAGPEAVVPLSGRNAGMGMTINVQAGLVANPDQIGQQIIEAIQRAQRRSGPVFAPA